MAGNSQKPTRTVFVGNIGPEVTEHQLSEIFSPIGALKSIRVVTEKETGQSKGYAFCAYYDLANAESAIRNLSNRDINGRPIRLGYAQDYAFRYDESSKGGAQGPPQAGLQQPGAPPLRPQAPELGQFQHQGLPQATIPTPAPTAPPPGPGPQDQISSTLARMSRPELYNILAQMKTLIEQNSAQARQILVQNPQLTRALFQAQVILGMVQGPGVPQPPQAAAAAPPQGHAPAYHAPAPSPPTAGAVSLPFANGASASGPNGFAQPPYAPQHSQPQQAAQLPPPRPPQQSQHAQHTQQQQTYGQQPYQQAAHNTPVPYQQQQQQQQPHTRPPQQYVSEGLPSQQQQHHQIQDQGVAAPQAAQPAAPANAAAEQQRALLEQVMKLTPQQIELLPPQQKAQVIALQQQMRQFQ